MATSLHATSGLEGIFVQAVVKRSARAILIDGDGHLLLIKRTKPDQDPYWTTPGGGVEPDDLSVDAALARELREELGAEIEAPKQVFLVSSPAGEQGVGVQHFFVCRLLTLNLGQRSGPEFDDPSRGGYSLDRVNLTDGSLQDVDLKPVALKDFILANDSALVDAVGTATAQA
jgi:ADP-ribose pyrophosphatase YjhB (NUDIX family)